MNPPPISRVQEMGGSSYQVYLLTNHNPTKTDKYKKDLYLWLTIFPPKPKSDVRYKAVNNKPRTTK